MQQPFKQFVYVRSGSIKLEARVRVTHGNARAGQWVWAVRQVKDRKVVAISRRPYLRKYGAVRGVRRAFPRAQVVIVAG